MDPVTSDDLLKAARSAVPEVDLADLKARRGDPAVAVLDVRDSAEVASGKIPGACHAQRGMLEFYLDRGSDFFLPALEGKTEVIMVCGSGGRAALAAKLARDMGWSASYLGGGMKAWRAAGEPTEPGEPAT